MKILTTASSGEFSAIVQIKNPLCLTMLAIVATGWCSIHAAPGKPEAKTSAESAALIQALDSKNYTQVLEILRAHGLDNRTLAEMKAHLGQTVPRAKLREPFLRAAIIGSLGALKPEELKIRLDAAATEGYQPVFWEINSFGVNWQQRFDQERTRFVTPPIGVLDVGLNDPDLVKFFLWFYRYSDRLHSVVINWERLDNWDFKLPSQQREANRVMNGLHQLIKARNPTAFVWVRVVWADDNSDVLWLKGLSFAPDGLLLWNLPAFDSPFEAARARYLPLVDPACPMVVAAFYGVWSQINTAKNLKGIGRTSAANLGALEKRLVDMGVHGLAPDGLLLKALLLARTDPNLLKALLAKPTRWKMDPVLAAYDKVGRKNPNWDKPVQEALRLYTEIRLGSPEVTEAARDQLGLSLYTAMQVGCDDPLIQCLYSRYYLRTKDSHNISFIQTSTQAAEVLEQSGYSEAQKFVGCLDAAKVLRNASLNRSDSLSDLERFRNAAATHLATLLKDKAVPEGEARAVCQDWIQSYNLRSGSLQEWYDLMAKPLFAAWPKAGWAWANKGDFYITFAWDARGKGLADTVKPEGWKLFFERLRVAHEAFERAWPLDPTLEEIPLGMLTVELGQGEERERMELWFERAMGINPNSFDACWRKLSYLEPKWHGSAQALIDFGRECVASEKWGGKVPLILVYAHSSVASYLPALQRTAYWRQPEVWPDLKDAYEKFFKLNPQEASWRYNYVHSAYQCEQWADLNKQLGLLGDNVDYSYFGGPEAYNDMVRQAKAHNNQNAK